MKPNRCCNTCRHWEPKPRALDVADYTGECKFNPPVINPAVPDTLTGQWPLTHMTEWCSKHQEKERARAKTSL